MEVMLQESNGTFVFETESYFVAQDSLKLNHLCILSVGIIGYRSGVALLTSALCL